MPYVDGQSLRERLSRKPPLPLPAVFRIAREAAQALEYAHQHGVIHRDVKPENILLTLDGSTLVADFGIARSTGTGSDRITSAGMVVGTPSYMSPEQASAEVELDGRTDIYSLGCVLYEMVAGRPPFTGATPHAVVARHLTEPPPPLRTLGRRVPPALERVILIAMAKSPDDRFSSAAAFATALDEAEAAVPRPPRTFWLVLLIVLLVLGALAVGALLLRRGEGASRGAGGGRTLASGFARKMAQITTGEGVEEWPAWSPDGARLAYVAEVAGFRQLFLRTLATGDERQLTHGARDYIQPAWSGDGRRLVFVRASADSGKLEPGDLNGWYFEGGDIWSLDVESGQESRLVSNAFGPTWSADGRQLAFDAAWAGPRRIWISNGEGRNPRQLTSDSSEAVSHTGARWSPDGRRLVFRRIEKTRSDIMVADGASGAAVALTHDAATGLDPAWSPDGHWIYFASNRGGGINVWRIAVGAAGGSVGAPQQLTTGAGDDIEPAPSPDGHRLAFAVRGLNADLWTLPVSPATGAAVGPPTPVVVSTREDSRGAWSPDGRTIAFNSDRQGEMNIWLHDVATGADRRVTSGPGGDYQPSWTPDGRTLAFFSGRGGSIDIWSVAVDDGRLRRLTDDPGMDMNPFYSPDGLSIAFMSDRLGRTDIWVMNADGSGQRRVTSSGAGGHFLRWTADGRAIVFRAETGTEQRVMRVAVESGALTPLPDVASGSHMSWSPDQSVIMDVRGHRTLWAHPVDGKPPRRVFEFDDSDIRLDYPVWSPDGKSVLFDRAAPHGGDLWLLDGIE
jgi:serine/threonine-protein kinase